MASLKCRYTFALSISLKEDFKTHVNKDGYGFRGKSKWASEAIEQLLSLKNFTELVNYNHKMINQLTEKDTLYIDFDLNKKLLESIPKVRKDFPLLEGVKSCIIRTAIIQRIIRGNLSQVT